jgi:hypothetical protein
MKTLKVKTKHTHWKHYIYIKPYLLDVQVGAWKHSNREIIGKRKIKNSNMGKSKNNLSNR